MSSLEQSWSYHLVISGNRDRSLGRRTPFIMTNYLSLRPCMKLEGSQSKVLYARMALTYLQDLWLFLSSCHECCLDCGFCTHFKVSMFLRRHQEQLGWKRLISMFISTDHQLGQRYWGQECVVIAPMLINLCHNCSNKPIDYSRDSQYLWSVFRGVTD